MLTLAYEKRDRKAFVRLAKKWISRRKAISNPAAKQGSYQLWQNALRMASKNGGKG